MFFLKVKEFEGFATHLYQDSKGYITIGVGIMFKNVNKLLNSGIRFMDRTTHKPATRDEILADWKMVSKQSKGKSAGYYKDFTKLDADPSDLELRFNSLMNNARNDALKFYPELDKLPMDIQFALWDMSYNLGYHKLSKYKKLREALLREDFEEAAAHSKRHGVQTERNRTISKWIYYSKPTINTFRDSALSARGLGHMIPK